MSKKLFFSATSSIEPIVLYLGFENSSFNSLKKEKNGSPLISREISLNAFFGFGTITFHSAEKKYIFFEYNFKKKLKKKIP
jgi:hypothetical protein